MKQLSILFLFGFMLFCFGCSSTITAPTDGDTFAEGDEITFEGFGKDFMGQSLPGNQLIWVSNIDGQLGTGYSLTTQLSEGDHVISLQFPNFNNLSKPDSINITVGEQQTTRAKVEQDQGNDGTIDSSVYITYNADRKPLCWEFDNDNDGIIDAVYSKTYDTYGNTIYSEFDSDGDGTIDTSYAYSYTYDAGGNISKREFDNLNDGTIDTVSYYSWDTDYIIETVELDIDNDGTIDGVSCNTYDADGNITRTEIFNDGTIDMISSFTWDAYGNLVYHGVDYGGDGTIDGISINIYTYDAYGNILKEEADFNNDGTFEFVNYYTWD